MSYLSCNLSLFNISCVGFILLEPYKVINQTQGFYHPASICSQWKEIGSFRRWVMLWAGAHSRGGKPPTGVLVPHPGHQGGSPDGKFGWGARTQPGEVRGFLPLLQPSLHWNLCQQYAVFTAALLLLIHVAGAALQTAGCGQQSCPSPASKI